MCKHLYTRPLECSEHGVDCPELICVACGVSLSDAVFKYEDVINEVLDTIADMRKSGDYDEDTLETLEWKLSPPKKEHTLCAHNNPTNNYDCLMCIEENN